MITRARSMRPTAARFAPILLLAACGALLPGEVEAQTSNAAKIYNAEMNTNHDAAGIKNLSYFNWGDIGSLDFVTRGKNQGNQGTCQIHSMISVLESQLMIDSAVAEIDRSSHSRYQGYLADHAKKAKGLDLNLAEYFGTYYHEALQMEHQRARTHYATGIATFEQWFRVLGVPMERDCMRVGNGGNADGPFYDCPPGRNCAGDPGWKAPPNAWSAMYGGGCGEKGFSTADPDSVHPSTLKRIGKPADAGLYRHNHYCKTGIGDKVCNLSRNDRMFRVDGKFPLVNGPSNGTGDVDAFKTALLNGPTYMYFGSVPARTQLRGPRRHGVEDRLRTCVSNGTGHQVALIGWEVVTGEHYWIIKNSYGEENAWRMRISATDYCGMSSGYGINKTVVDDPMDRFHTNPLTRPYKVVPLSVNGTRDHILRYDPRSGAFQVFRVSISPFLDLELERFGAWSPDMVLLPIDVGADGNTDIVMATDIDGGDWKFETRSVALASGRFAGFTHGSSSSTLDRRYFFHEDELFMDGNRFRALWQADGSYMGDVVVTAAGGGKFTLNLDSTAPRPFFWGQLPPNTPSDMRIENHVWIDPDNDAGTDDILWYDDGGRYHLKIDTRRDGSSRAAVEGRFEIFARSSPSSPGATDAAIASIGGKDHYRLLIPRKFHAADPFTSAANATAIADGFRITMESIGMDPLEDTYIEVRDREGNLVAFNDDWFPGLRDSQVSIPTQVFLQDLVVVAGSFADQHSGSYRIGVHHYRCDPAANLGRATHVTTTGNTGFDTNQFESGCGGRNAPEDVFVWTVPEDGTYRIDTVGSSFDTVLYVTEGATCGGRHLACNDDHAGGRQSAVTASFRAGQTLNIYVDGFGPDSGSYNLNIARQ